MSPDGAVLLDCGSEATFICNVTGLSTVWTINGLSVMCVPETTEQFAANNNSRITTTDTSGLTQSSIITITGFTTSDNGGTVAFREWLV